MPDNPSDKMPATCSGLSEGPRETTLTPRFFARCTMIFISTVLPLPRGAQSPHRASSPHPCSMRLRNSSTASRSPDRPASSGGKAPNLVLNRLAGNGCGVPARSTKRRTVAAASDMDDGSPSGIYIRSAVLQSELPVCADRNGVVKGHEFFYTTTQRIKQEGITPQPLHKFHPRIAGKLYEPTHPTAVADQCTAKAAAPSFGLRGIRPDGLRCSSWRR